MVLIAPATGKMELIEHRRAFSYQYHIFQ